MVGTRMLEVWKTYDERALFLLNRTIRCSPLDRLLPLITHAGSAVCTIVCSVLVWMAGGPGFEGLLALALSHAVVHVVKRKFTRSRPYLRHDALHVVEHPLTDYSFPSGHTTAICSLSTTLLLTMPWLTPLLVPLSLLVGLSRIYLGLHYPTDVAVGAAVGIGFAAIVHLFPL